MPGPHGPPHFGSTHPALPLNLFNDISHCSTLHSKCAYCLIPEEEERDQTVDMHGSLQMIISVAKILQRYFPKCFQRAYFLYIKEARESEDSSFFSFSIVSNLAPNLLVYTF